MDKKFNEVVNKGRWSNLPKVWVLSSGDNIDGKVSNDSEKRLEQVPVP